MVRNVIVVRMYYDNREMLRERAKITQVTLIPSLLKQTVQDFKLIILADNFVEDLKELIKYDFIHLTTFEDLVEYCKTNNVRNQTRIDSDDALMYHFIDLINKEADKRPGETLLNFNPLHWDFEKGEMIRTEPEYNDGKTSMFLTLVNLNHTSHVYQHPHHKMWAYYNTVTISGTHTVYNVHPAQIMKLPLEERRELRQTPKRKELK